MVIMIDKSKRMDNVFGARKRMYFGIEATKEIIKSLNPNDNVRRLYKKNSFSSAAFTTNCEVL